MISWYIIQLSGQNPENHFSSTRRELIGQSSLQSAIFKKENNLEVKTLTHLWLQALLIDQNTFRVLNSSSVPRCIVNKNEREEGKEKRKEKKKFNLLYMEVLYKSTHNWSGLTAVQLFSRRGRRFLASKTRPQPKTSVYSVNSISEN